MSGDREEFVTEMFLHFTYQVAAFSNDAALVQRAAEFHYQFGRHIPTPRPGGCELCKERHVVMGAETFLRLLNEEKK